MKPFGIDVLFQVERKFWIVTENLNGVTETHLAISALIEGGEHTGHVVDEGLDIIIVKSVEFILFRIKASRKLTFVSVLIETGSQDLSPQAAVKLHKRIGPTKPFSHLG